MSEGALEDPVAKMAEWCRSKLQEHATGLQEARITAGIAEHGDVLVHEYLHVLCNQIQDLVVQGEWKGKLIALRWLGMVQGALWSMGLITVDEMRSAAEDWVSI